MIATGFALVAVGFGVAWHGARRRARAQTAAIVRVNAMLQHEVRHRVRCEKALRELGVEPPSSGYDGWFD